MTKINQKLLKELRKHLNLTQKEVADFLCIGRTSYTKIETGLQDVDSEILTKLSDLFKVSTDQLLGKENYEVPQSFSKNYVKAATITGEILSMDDEKKIALTIEVLNRMKTMSTEQIKKLNDFLKVMK